MIDIADIHCDLLLYLAGGESRTPYDLDVRCSIPQLREGRVAFQTLAVFAETEPGSEAKGLAQIEIFQKLLHHYPDEFCLFNSSFKAKADLITLALAIENASALWSEIEPLDLRRLEKISREVSPIIYISLTWNTENRFGGGAHTRIGLKEDGKSLLRFLDKKGIAVDFSHTSDQLAYDILNFVDQNQLQIPLIASHSNFRAIADVARNLPDELAIEIFRRGGIVGLNFIRDFVGADTPSNLIRQVEHGLKIGGENQLCLGADFFYDQDLSPAHRKPPEKLFFSEFGHAGTYPAVLKMWREALGLEKSVLEKIAHKNFYAFLMKLNG
jgi:membrane dipeptidase